MPKNVLAAQGGLPTPARAGASEGSAPDSSPAGESRRRHRRFKVEGAIVSLGGGGLLARFGMGRSAHQVVNLSESGLLIRGQKRIVPGTRVQVRIEIAKYSEKIESEGEVRWSGLCAKADSEFYTGILFVALAPLEQKKLASMREWFTSQLYRQRSSMRQVSYLALEGPR